MSNVLKVSLQTTIYSLAARGWSQRRIARELGINRETVGRYLRLAEAKPAISTPGLGGDSESKPAILTLGVEGGEDSKPANSTARRLQTVPRTGAGPSLWLCPYRVP
jgi:predicted transcriptional regulator